MPSPLRMKNFKAMRNLWLAFFILTFLVSGCSVNFQFPPGKATRSGVYHTVQKGETLWRISKTYNVSVAAIKQANGLKSDEIESGQRLLIPGTKTTKTIQSPPRTGRPPKPSVIIKPTAKKATGTPIFSWPITGRIISTNEEAKRDKRVAIEGKTGETITTSRAGQVFFLGETKVYSSTLIVDHLDGFYSVYGGDILITVHEGEILAKDSTIGKMASDKEKPVIFFEIRRGTEPVNPLNYLNKR